MLNPITVQELAKTHQREQSDLWREADVRRMARQAKAAQPAQPGPVERIAAEVGILLMGVGQRLTEHRALPG
jgi:hypothetical protein